MKKLYVAAVVAAFLALAGCGNDTVSTEAPQGHGVVSVRITDGPIDLSEISNLFVTFDRLYASPQPDSSSDSTGAPVEIITAPITLDLLTLTNGVTADLGLANLPEGDYRAMTLFLNQDGAWLIEAEGDTHDVKVPSNRVRIVTDFTVSEGAVSDIVLDFDAAGSLNRTGNGYILRPVVRQLPDRPLAASIEGDVWVDTPDGLVSAGEYMVPNPRFRRRGNDHGDGDRPGGRGGNGNGNGGGNDRHNDGTREMVPLTMAWPMMVHASVMSDSTDGDSTSAAAWPGGLERLGEDVLGDRLAHRPHPRTTIVGLRGHYKLWRLRKGGTYNLRMFMHPRSGFQVISAPDPVELLDDVIGQDFVVKEQASSNTP